MVASMSHRGPDDHGVVSLKAGGRSVTLGSARLAVLDLSPSGHMPMEDPASGNRIVYNGEVYNYRELRDLLESLGETFFSETDTEVVLKGYRRWGEDVVRGLRGMFAFAIWNHARRELFVARDRLGEKPLYHWNPGDGRFLFGSEVRALLASGLVPRRLEQDALPVYLSNGFLAGPLTMVRGVESLPPAHWMRVSAEGRVLETVQYWRPEAARPAAGEPDSGERLRAELEEAVRMRLVSDLPVGAFLSGGLDSSIIVAIAAEAGPRVRTFSVTFDEAGYDESAYSDWVARRFATGHSQVRLCPREFAGWLPNAVDAMDQPTYDGVNTYCVSRAAKAAGLTVALSGLGGDETFGGYPFFNTVPWVERCASLAAGAPAPLLRLASQAMASQGFRVSAPWKLAEAWHAALENGVHRVPRMLPAYQSAQLLFPWWVRQQLIAAGAAGNGHHVAFGLPDRLVALLNSEADSGRPDNQLSLLSLRLFLGERCLRDSDSMSMAVSLELRSVFTDHRFIEAAWSVPAARRCAGAPDKPFLRRLFSSRLGEDFPARKKQGFVLPLDAWLQRPRVLGWIEEVLSSRSLVSSIGLEPGVVSGLLGAYRRRRPRVPWSRVWALFVLARWCQHNRVSL